MSEDRIRELAGQAMNKMPSPVLMRAGTAQRVQALVEDVLRRARDEALEQAAALHDSIDVACDHEREHGAPGAAAMAAVIEYRDKIRALRRSKP